mgnify:CR=1 FL=1
MAAIIGVVIGFLGGLMGKGGETIVVGMPPSGVTTTFDPSWLAADAQRMNAFIEDLVNECPAQYNWAHKRFKTRPPGEPKWY